MLRMAPGTYFRMILCVRMNSYRFDWSIYCRTQGIMVKGSLTLCLVKSFIWSLHPFMILIICSKVQFRQNLIAIYPIRMLDMRAFTSVIMILANCVVKLMVTIVIMGGQTPQFCLIASVVCSCGGNSRSSWSRLWKPPLQLNKNFLRRGMQEHECSA